MSKATADDLGALHRAVSQVLTKKIAAPLYREGEPVPDTEGLGATAAEISAAITFLKNNGVTADPSEDKGLQDLARQLEEQRKRAKGRLNREALERAAQEMEEYVGYTGRVQ